MRQISRIEFLKYPALYAYTSGGDALKTTTTTGQLKRYFLHGIFFSILMDVMVFAWAFMLFFLLFFGFLVGLIAGFVVLFLLMGAINAFVTSSVWKVNVKSDWGADLAHGFVLFIVLLIVSIPVSVVSDFVAPASDMTSLLVKFIATLIVMAFIDGYIAKAIAGNWISEYNLPKAEARDGYKPLQEEGGKVEETPKEDKGP